MAAGLVLLRHLTLFTITTFNKHNGAAAPGENKMRLYVSKNNQWTGTQSDAKALGSFDQIEVPTDKPGLIAFLNCIEPKTSEVDTITPVDIVSDQYSLKGQTYSPGNTVPGKCSLVELKELSTILLCLMNKVWNEMEQKED